MKESNRKAIIKMILAGNASGLHELLYPIQRIKSAKVYDGNGNHVKTIHFASKDEYVNRNL